MSVLGWPLLITGEGMATHSNILAWRIPWTEKLGELLSTGSKESDITEQLTHTLKYNQGALKHCIQKVQPE